MSRMKWDVPVVRMKDERLRQRSETKKQEGYRKRGRPQQRWDNCVKRDMRKAEEENGSENANNRDQWKTFTKISVQGVTTNVRPVSPIHKGNRRGTLLYHIGLCRITSHCIAAQHILSHHITYILHYIISESTVAQGESRCYQ